jgi:hypothetical protein
LLLAGLLGFDGIVVVGPVGQVGVGWGGLFGHIRYFDNLYNRSIKQH